MGAPFRRSDMSNCKTEIKDAVGGTDLPCSAPEKE
jgi:hypothetical protein